MIDTWWQWISAIVLQSSILILALALLGFGKIRWVASEDSASRNGSVLA